MDQPEHKEREGTGEDVAAPAPSQNDRADESRMNMYNNYRALQATVHMIGQIVHITTANGDKFNGVLVAVSPAMDLVVAEAGQVLSPDGRTGRRSESMMIRRDNVLMVTAFGVDLRGGQEDTQLDCSVPDPAILLPPDADRIHTQDDAALPMEAPPGNTIRPGAVPDSTAEDGATVSSSEAADTSPGDGVTPGTTAEASPEGLSAKDLRDDSPGTEETLSAEASSGIAGASQGDASSPGTSPQIPRGDQSPGTAERTSGEEAPGSQKASQGEKSSGTLESLERGTVPPGTAEVSQDDVLSQDNPKASQDDVLSQNNPKVSQDDVLSQDNPKVSQDDVLSQNNPKVSQDDVLSQDNPKVSQDDVLSSDNPKVSQDDVLSSDNPKVSQDDVLSSDNPEVSQDDVLSSDNPEVSQDDVLSQDNPKVSQDDVLSSDNPKVSQDDVLSSDNPKVSQDDVLSSDNPEVSQDDALSPENPKVSQDDVLSLDNPEVSQDDVLSPDNPKVSQDDVLSLDNPEVSQDDVLSQDNPKVSQDDVLSLDNPEVSQDDVLSQDNPEVSQDSESPGTSKASKGAALSPGTTEASQEAEFPGTTEASQEAEFPGTTEAGRDNAVSPRTAERLQEEADDVTCAADTSGASGEDRAFAVVTAARAQQTGVKRGSLPHQHVQMEVVRTTLAEDLVLQGTVLSKTKQNFMTLSNVTVLPSAGCSQVFDAILRMTIDVSKLLHVQRVSSQEISRMGRGREPAPGNSPQARQEQNSAGTAAEDLRQAQGERRRGSPASEQLCPSHRAQRRGDSTNDSTNDYLIQELDQHHYADVAHGGDLIRIRTDIEQRLGDPDSYKMAPAMTGCGGGEDLASLPDDEPSEEFVMVDSEAGEGSAVLPKGELHEDYENMINELYTEHNTPDEDLADGKDNALVEDCAVWPCTDPCEHFVHVKVDELDDTSASAEVDELDDTSASAEVDSGAGDDSLSVDYDADSSDSDSPPISNMGDMERAVYDDPESPEAASGEDLAILKEAAHADRRFADHAEVGHCVATTESSPEGDLSEMVYEPPESSPEGDLSEMVYEPPEPRPQARSQAGQEPRMPEPDPDVLTAAAPDKEAAQDRVRGVVSPDRSGRRDDESQSLANFEQYMTRVQLINKRVKVRLAKALAFEGHLQSVDTENQMELTDVTVLPPGGRPPLAGVIPEMTLTGTVALAVEPVAEKNNDTGSDGKDAQKELVKFFDDSNDNEDTDFLLGSDGNVGWDPNDMLSMIPSNFTPDVLVQYTGAPRSFHSMAVREEREIQAERHALQILATLSGSLLDHLLENE